MAKLQPLGIVCHVSASTWGDADAIDSWHKQRGWSGIGYHDVVLNGRRGSGSRYDQVLDGKIEPGRDRAVKGAHCLADGMNQVTLGVCCIGNPGWRVEGAPMMPFGPLGRVCRREYMTRRQFAALVHLLSTRCAQYGLDPRGAFNFEGKTHDVISQHSDHDRGKPLCASLNTRILAKAVAAAMGRRDG